MSEEIVNLLNRYAEIKKRIDELETQKSFRKNEILEPVLKSLEQLEQTFIEVEEPLNSELSAVKAAIDAGVIGLQQSVKGAEYQAIYTKPRVTWDSKGLDGFAIAHPEINAFRKVGEPSVSIRGMK